MKKVIPIKQDLVRRQQTVFYILVALSLFILGRVLYIQIKQGDYWRSKIRTSTIKMDKIEADRGNIYADDGSLLATSTPQYTLVFDPNVADHSVGNAKLYNKHINFFCKQLSLIFKDKPASYYKNQILKSRNNTDIITDKELFKDKMAKNKKQLAGTNKQYLDPYSTINLGSRKINFFEKQILDTLSFIKAGRYASGLFFDKKNKREHPFDNMALRTIGNIIGDNEPSRGLEASMDKYLRGADGKGMFEKLKGGFWKPMDENPSTKPIEGQDVHTTLNVNIQDETETALRRAVEKYKPHYATAIVMEVKTGEIKAIANLSYSDKQQAYVESQNYAIGFSTTPGSTFKLPTMLALLEEGVKPTDIVDTGYGIFPYKGKTLSDSHKGGFGQLTVQEVFEKSSNIGIVKLVLQKFGNNEQKYYDYLEKFKLTEMIGFQMKGEPKPTFYAPGDHRHSSFSMPWTAFGGIEAQVTPLQMLTFYNAIANDGYWVEPIIVKEIKQANEVKVDLKEKQRRLEKPLASKESIATIKKMMEGVVLRGTARKQFTDKYNFAGKTGTSRKLKNGGFYEGIFYTAFAGYFPAESPRYSVIVVLDEPKGENSETLYAGDVCAPVFREIADHIYADDLSLVKNKKIDPTHTLTVNNMKDDEEALTGTNLKNIKVKNKEVVVNANAKPSKTVMPNVMGMSLRDALYILENKNLKVSYTGLGKVKTQSIAPGLMANKGNIVSLNLAL